MTLSRRRFVGLAAAGAVAAGAHADPWSWFLPSSGKGGWDPVAGLPWSTQEVYAAVCDGRIVVAGGLRSGSDSSMRFETLSGTAMFEPGTDVWRPGPDLPEARHHLVLAAVGGAVYGFGGFVGESLRDGFRVRRDVFALRDGAWSRVGRMPVPLGETVAAALGGRVHLATGSAHPDSGTVLTETRRHLVYDPEEEEWTTARPVPTPRSSAAGAVIGGRLYVVGGRRREHGLQNLDALERYDPGTDRWTRLRPLPSPAGGLAAAALDGCLVCFGGERFGPDGGGVFASTWLYDPASDAWRELSPMPTPRHGLAAAATGGKAYAIGGNTAPAIGAATSRVVEALTVPESQ